MSTVIEQLAALTEIRKLARKFDIDFVDEIEWKLIPEIHFEHKQTWNYNLSTEAYELVDKQECKVCADDDEDYLIEVPTYSGGKFYICLDCKDEIANKTVEKVS